MVSGGMSVMITIQPLQITDTRMPAPMINILFFTVCFDFVLGGGEESELPSSVLQDIRLLPVTARNLVTRQSHSKRLLRTARNDPFYDDQSITLQQAAGKYLAK